MPRTRLQLQLSMIFSTLKQAAECIIQQQYGKAQNLLLPILYSHPQFANAMYLYALTLNKTSEFEITNPSSHQPMGGSLAKNGLSQNQGHNCPNTTQLKKNKNSKYHNSSLSNTIKQRCHDLNEQFYAKNNNDPTQICTKIIKLSSGILSKVKIYESLSLLARILLLDQFMTENDYNTVLLLLSFDQVIQSSDGNIADLVNKLTSNGLTIESRLLLVADFSKVGNTHLVNNEGEDGKSKDQIISYYALKYYQISQYTKSMEMYKLSIILSPKDPMYWHNVSILSYLLRDYKQSEYYIEKTLELQSKRPKSLYIQAFIYCKTGRLYLAYSRIVVAIQQSPSQVLYYMKMVVILFMGQEQIRNLNGGSSSQVKSQNMVMSEQQVHKSEQGQVKGSGLKGVSTKQNIEKYIEKCKHILQDSLLFGNRGVYFVGKESLAQFINYLSENVQFYFHTIENMSKCKDTDEGMDRYGQLWREYIRCLDDYLIHGSFNKYKVKIQMGRLAEQMSEISARLNQNAQKELTANQGQSAR